MCLRGSKTGKLRKLEFHAPDTDIVFPEFLPRDFEEKFIRTVTKEAKPLLRFLGRRRLIYPFNASFMDGTIKALGDKYRGYIGSEKSKRKLKIEAVVRKHKGEARKIRECIDRTKAHRAKAAEKLALLESENNTKEVTSDEC